jgi:hypothetical protein
MKSPDSNKIRLVLFVIVVGIIACYGSAKADFTFGEPVNLGQPINSGGSDHSACISTDGLSLYFTRGEGESEGEIWESCWVTSRINTEKVWGPPSNMGPTVNSPNFDGGPCTSADGLSLYFFSDRPGGLGAGDLWVSTRATVDDSWGSPIILEAIVNSAFDEYAPSISADGLELYFTSDRPGGSGNWDLWVTTRVTTNDNWQTPTNLGPTINSSAQDNWPGISPDGLVLFFGSNRSGGAGSWDLYMVRRSTREDPWGPPMNLGSEVNSTTWETGPKVSPDGSMLCFQSPRPGGFGSVDIWQAPIEPVVDLNSDGIVDSSDMCIIVDHWGTDEPLCDIGPMPWGDGIVDVQDLIVLAEHLFEEIPPAK